MRSVFAMTKICGKSVCKPLQFIFSECIDSGFFKQFLEKYRPVSLLPICGKTLERLIFNKMFRFRI